METNQDAIDTKINEIHDAVIDGEECPQRGCEGEDSYCKNSCLAEKAECPYLGEIVIEQKFPAVSSKNICEYKPGELEE